MSPLTGYSTCCAAPNVIVTPAIPRQCTPIVYSGAPIKLVPTVIVGAPIVMSSDPV